MVKLNDMSPTNPEITNVFVFSDKISQAIREASDAVHPAAIVGVLQFHSQAILAATQGAFLRPSGPMLFMPKKGL